MYCYAIGCVGYKFETDNELLESPYHDLFRINEKDFNNLQNKHTYIFQKSMPEISGKVIFSSGSFTVYESNDTYIKVSNRFDEFPYNVIFTQKKGESGGQIYFTDGGYKKLKTTAELFRIIDMMSALLYYDSLMLHSSFIEYNNKAILFSGNPGIGKSTQAKLWEIYKNAAVINGDRSIIHFAEDNIYACGTPACGSSDICLNKNIPVQAIVFLKQSPANKVNTISSPEKFLALNAQISCGVRKPEDTDKLLSLIEKLINTTQIIELECTPDNRAVEVLLKAIGDTHV